MLRRLSILNAPKAGASNIPFARQANTRQSGTASGAGNMGSTNGRSARASGRAASIANAMDNVGDPQGKMGRLMTFLKDNMGGLTTYQLVLEGVFTAYFFAGLKAKWFTVEGLERIFVHKLMLPESWVGFKDATYEEDYVVPYLGMSIDKETMTFVHTGHNVAFALLPLQFLFVIATFPLAQHTWRGQVKPVLSRVPFLAPLLEKPTMPREFADKVMWATANKRREEEAARQASSVLDRGTKKSGFRR